eukprot:EG_transcript_14742
MAKIAGMFYSYFGALHQELCLGQEFGGGLREGTAEGTVVLGPNTVVRNRVQGEGLRASSKLVQTWFQVQDIHMCYLLQKNSHIQLCLSICTSNSLIVILALSGEFFLRHLRLRP